MKTAVIAILMGIHLVPVVTAQQVETSCLEVSDIKMVHVVFPKPVVYVDLGSNLILAGRVEWAENIIRVKSAVNGFDNETTFSVMTAESKLYTFIVTYNPDPLNLNVVIEQSYHGGNITNEPEIKIIRPNKVSPGELTALIDGIYKEDRKTSRKRGVKQNGMRFYMKGLYSTGDILIFHLVVENRTNIPFNKDFIRFTISDRKMSKRTPVQSIQIEPLATGGDNNKIGPGQKSSYIIVMQNIILPNNRQLQVQLIEVGGRRIGYKVRDIDIYKSIKI